MASEAGEIKQGKIVKLIADKGFGFIAVEGEPPERPDRRCREVFFHASACDGAFDDLREQDLVTFREEPDDRKRNAVRAMNVELLDYS